MCAPSRPDAGAQNSGASLVPGFQKDPPNSRGGHRPGRFLVGPSADRKVAERLMNLKHKAAVAALMGVAGTAQGFATST